MNRVPFILSAIALAVLAGCASEPKVTTAPAPVVVVLQSPALPGRLSLPPRAVALRAGIRPHRVDAGRYEPYCRSHGVEPEQAYRHAHGRRLGAALRHAGRGMAVGDRIEITANGTLRHPA